MKEEPGVDRENVSAPLPWHVDAWDAVVRRRATGRMPHALLISGPAGLGKTDFGRALAKAVHCRQASGEATACGNCPECRQFEAGSLPDWLELGVPPKKKYIAVDQIRELGHWFSLTPAGGGGRIALIQPAERMTTEAANSLLKTLEEPPPGSLLMLIADMPGRLPATVRSRCQQVQMKRPDRKTALEWLEQGPGVSDDWPALLDLAGGSPLRAVRLREQGALERARKGSRQLIDIANGRESVIQVAADWVKQGLAESLQWWAVWLENLVRRGQAGAGHGGSLLEERAEDLQKLEARIDWKAVHELIAMIRAAERRLESANAELLAESLLRQWVRANSTQAENG